MITPTITIPDFKEIDLDDRELFNQYAHAFEYENMESNFTNVYIWQKSWHIKYAVFCDAIVLCMCDSKRKPFLLPPMVRDRSVSIKPAMDFCREMMEEHYGYFLMRGINNITRRKIIEDCGDTYAFTQDRNTSEYVYNSSDLIELPGDKFHAKKNHLNKFLKLYQYEYDRYDDVYFTECMDLFREWAKNRDGNPADLAAEEDSVRRALQNHRAFGLKGCVIKIDGRVRAFSIGEALNSHMAVIHIEKADASYQGLYQLVNHDFIKNEWSAYPFINRQEDMGIPGLRKAKESYHPAYMVEKFNCFLNGENDGLSQIK